MATIAKLCELGVLEDLDPGLDPAELPTRQLYGTVEFVAWLNDVLPELVVEDDPLSDDLSPMEQVAALFSEYLLGETFSTDRRFKKLNATPQHHVWELKTPDVRIFGWVPAKDCFICCFGDLKNAVVTFNKYGMYMARTKLVRDKLDLDEPKCVESREFKDVIST